MALRDVTIPKFQADPFYKSSQKALSPVGANLLQGDIPEWLRPISESGGDEFDKMLSQILGDTQDSVYGAGARAGTRGPRLAATMGRETGRISTEARFKDYMRMLEGRKWLFGQGKGITEGVRGAGLTDQSQVNQFALSAAQMSLNKEGTLDRAKARKKEQEDAFWAEIMSAGIGAAGTIAGFAIGGPVGGAFGGQLGSAGKIGGGGGKAGAESLIMGNMFG